MKVLFVGPGVRGRYGKFYYSMDKKLRNGFARAGHNCLFMSDRDVATIAPGMRMFGRSFANSKFLELVRSFQPDFVVLFLAHIISRPALEQAKQAVPGLRVANVECDLMNSDERINRHANFSGVVDATFVTSGGDPLGQLRSLHRRVSYIPNPCDFSVDDVCSHDEADHAYDVTYVSSLQPSSGRWDLFNALESELPELRFGRFGIDKRLFGTAYFSVLAKTRATLNWSERNDVPFYASDRVAQLFGCGTCVCLDKRFGYEKFLTSDEAIFFESQNDLKTALQSALAEEHWRQIARNGRQAYHRLFNETRVADYILKYTSEEDVSAYEWHDI
ncbi:MAG: glycosyltransferase [Pseudomonadota bacterium]